MNAIVPVLASVLLAAGPANDLPLDVHLVTLEQGILETYERAAFSFSAREHQWRASLWQSGFDLVSAGALPLVAEASVNPCWAKSWRTVTMPDRQECSRRSARSSAGFSAVNLSKCRESDL